MQNFSQIKMQLSDLFQPIKIKFCQIKISIVQNDAARLMLIARSMATALTLCQRTDNFYWKQLQEKKLEKIYEFSYPKIPFVGFINV